VVEFNATNRPTKKPTNKLLTQAYLAITMTDGSSRWSDFTNGIISTVANQNRSAVVAIGLA